MWGLDFEDSLARGPHPQAEAWARHKHGLKPRIAFATPTGFGAAFY